MEYAYQIIRLEKAFYVDYPHNKYPEIMDNKCGRQYNCLLVDTHYDFYICLPYRTNIDHKYAFKFKRTGRKTRTHSGLDYSKMVLINQDKYISSTNAIIDRLEYIETVRHIGFIVCKAVEYLDGYIEYLAWKGNMSQEEFNRRYSRSTLSYFHDIISI